MIVQVTLFIRKSCIPYCLRWLGLLPICPSSPTKSLSRCFQDLKQNSGSPGPSLAGGLPCLSTDRSSLDTAQSIILQRPIPTPQQLGHVSLNFGWQRASFLRPNQSKQPTWKNHTYLVPRLSNCVSSVRLFVGIMLLEGNSGTPVDLPSLYHGLVLWSRCKGGVHPRHLPLNFIEDVPRKPRERKPINCLLHHGRSQMRSKGKFVKFRLVMIRCWEFSQLMWYFFCRMKHWLVFASQSYPFYSSTDSLWLTW